MPYKTVLVHLDTTPRCGARVDLALDLAGRHGGRLHACFAQSDAGASVLQPMQRATDDLTAAYERVCAEVTAKAEAAGVEARCSMSPLVGSANIIHFLVRACRHADLAVIGQFDRDTGRGVVPEDMAEQVVLNAGRPVLVVPYAGDFPRVHDHVMVAWNAGREAARALSDAVPLLQQARRVTLLIVRGKGESETDSPGYRPEEAEAWLAGHGVTADVATAVGDHLGIVDMLLNRATDDGATMLVMGAHGHYGFPHILRGGVTRDMLRHMTVPVLLSH